MTIKCIILGQEPAFPMSDPQNQHEPGMSKRFYAACAAMQGVLANHHNYPTSEGKEDLIKVSYDLADELLKQEDE